MWLEICILTVIEYNVEYGRKDGIFKGNILREEIEVKG